MADEITRNEVYLSAIAEGSSDVPEPITREEQYLAKIAGADVGIPEKAITRKEQYYKKIVDNGGGGGSATLIEKSISANGVYNASDDSADGYSKATVNVPNSYAAGDEGKVVSNGALVSQSSATYTENGTYDTTLKNSVTVNVSNEPPIVTEKDINFYDYDGTLLYSYTKAEWANVTALPPNPSHVGLISQGWNFSKTWIDDNYQSFIIPLQVGQLYVTESGATEIDISLNSWFLSPTLSVCPNGTVSIDWGDGSAQDTLTGTSLTSAKTQQHTYASAGNYTIKISLTSGTSYTIGYGTTSSSMPVLYDGTNNQAAANQTKFYQNAIKRIRLGLKVTQLNGWSLANCSNLESITFPRNQFTSFGGRETFVQCGSLKGLVCPNYDDNTCLALWGQSVTERSGGIQVIAGRVNPSGASAFRDLYALKYVNISPTHTKIEGGALQTSSIQVAVIPSSVTEIKNNSFYGCRSLKYVHLLSETVPTLENTQAFSYNASGRKFYVPRSENQTVLNAYKTASNWSSFASSIEEEPA